MTRSRNSRKGNLSWLEDRILLVLDLRPVADDVEIADMVGVAPVEVSIALRRLETLGLVRQSPKEQS